MNCPRCGSDKITFATLQDSAHTKESGRGCLWGMVRVMLIIFTFGLWLLVGKSKGKHKTTYTTKTVATCQNCGNSWQIS